MMKNFQVLLFLLCTSFSFSQNEDQKEIDSLLQNIKKTKIDTVKCNNYNQISSLYLYRDIDTNTN